MKKILFSAIFLIFLIGNLLAQETTTGKAPEYREGVLNVKLRSDYPLTFTADSNTREIPLDQIPFLKKMAKRYGIRKVLQSFTINNDDNMLHIITVVFDKTDKTDKFIVKLQKDKHIEWVERLAKKHLSMSSTMPQRKQQR